MYEFEYEVFDFLKKFQQELTKKIFVITNNNSFEFYYTEYGVMFSSSASFEMIHENMQEMYNTSTVEDSISIFKQIYLKDISEPISVKKDTEQSDIENIKKPININVQISEKLKNIKFVLV